MAKHKKVDNTLAQGCVANYVKIYQGSTDPAVKTAYSDGAVLDKTELIEFLKTLKTPSVKITFGVYTDEYVKQYPTAKNGRLTAFMYPSTVIPPDIKLVAGAYVAPGDGGIGSGDGDPLNIIVVQP